ncbi:MAG: 8-amino-7-oxononanoate synthase [Gammaproteobacteria bacterium]
MAAQLDGLRDQKMYRHRRVLGEAQGREVYVGGQRLLNFCSNDYLGLAADERVRTAFKAGVDRWGVGSGASHLVCGHMAVHHELEEALADFSRRPRALLFSSGYAANLGTINALVTQGDHVFEDRLNHASLLDGGWISRASFHWYRHGDAAHLADKLSANPGDRQLIVTDGTFSMDGDQCDLDEMIPVAASAGAWLMVDDAHGMGVLGPQGCGVVDPAQYDTHQVPVLMGTLGKAFGTAGAFVAGDEVLIETLIQRARNYIYTTALPPAVAAASLASLRIAREEDWRREHLRSLISYFRAGAAAQGLDLMDSATPIQPVLLGEPGTAVAISAALEARGLLVGAIRPPTVPKGTSRLRITLTAGHTESDVAQLLSALAKTIGEQEQAI